MRQARRPEAEPRRKLRHARTIARIAIAISGDSGDFANVLPRTGARGPKRQQPIGTRMRTRRWPWQYSTPSWPAAYNLACAYAALAAYTAPETTVGHLVTKVIDSLEFAVCNPECEMERPSEWIGNDPDFSWLSGQNIKASRRSSMARANETTQPTVADLGRSPAGSAASGATADRALAAVRGMVSR